MIWTHNTVFIWPTDDRKLIGEKGDEISIEISQSLAAHVGISRSDLCEYICQALNKQEDPEQWRTS